MWRSSSCPKNDMGNLESSGRVHVIAEDVGSMAL